MKSWRTIDSKLYNETADVVEYLREKRYKASDWIVDISSRLDKKCIPSDVDLYRVSLEQLGVNNATTLQNVYDLAAKQQLAPLDPLMAIFTRSLYDDQPVGEWLRIAVPLDSMIDSDGVPHLPKLGHALNAYYVETYWSWPHAIFHPTNEFVFVKSNVGD